MIVIAYNFVIFLQAVYLLGNAYAAVKFYKLPHRWGRYVSVAFFANAVQALFGLLTLGFGPRPARYVWWAIAAMIVGQAVRAAGIATLTLFLFGWINGVGNYAKPEAENVK
jgi:hypothetical protein